ncbi:MAG TPA: thioredoxin domain-containing protein [Terriglobales bacterium]|jgi:protein-disulfide isomerase|nr:thioredoxin domain-containing protein [Terriglobales bacterium]
MHSLLKYIFITVLLLTLASAQQAPAAPHAATKTANLPSEETVNAFLHQWFGYDSSLTWKIISIKPSEIEGLSEINAVLSGAQGQQQLKLYVTPDGKHAVNGEIMPFGAHPFAANQKELERGINGPSRGPADAPVTVVDFSDLQCPHCKDAHPTLDKLVAENKNVRLVFQNFPLPMHDWAAKAAAYADCVSRSSNDAFWKFISSVFAAQSDITAANADEKLTALADSAGVKGSDIAACAAKPETTSRVEKSVALGKALDVNSTPTIFINGRKLPAVPYEVLQKLVDFAAKENTQAKK